MKHFTQQLVTAVGCAVLTVAAGAHDAGSLAGTPVCLESNLMAADAMNAPFSNIPGLGRVIEMNITTGQRGITVNNSLTALNAGGPICPDHIACPGPFKPTGILSGGENGHAYLTSAAQHALIEHHRDGTPIRTSPLWPTDPSPDGLPPHGEVPRLLGNGFMPNGNIAQTTCDANFFNAPNSDPFAAGESAVNVTVPMPFPARADNSSWMYFPPVYGTDERSGNGRVVVIDQNTLEMIDEYTKPTEGPYADDPRWNCPAGVIFTSEGMFVSMFHGDAVFVIDWKAGIDKESRGTGSNKIKKCGNSSDDDGDNCTFKLGRMKNEATVIRVIDLLDDGTGAPDDGTWDSPHRRDNLRAIRMSEDGTLYGTRRSRSRECLRGEAPGATSPGPVGPACNPSVFRQHIFVAGPGEDHRTGTIAMDPGVNVIAGVTINRMSGPGCDYVEDEELSLTGTNSGDACDVETLYVGVSAGNAGCDPDGNGLYGPGHPANQCFKPGGTIYEYRIDAAHLDGASGPCTGSPVGVDVVAAGNDGCALPIAQFDFLSDGVTSSLPAGTVEKLDPRMVMTIHEAFVQ